MHGTETVKSLSTPVHLKSRGLHYTNKYSSTKSVSNISSPKRPTVCWVGRL